MVRQLLILACLLGLNLSVVVCREDHDHRPHFSDFMSHHHRRSTPGEIIPSTEVPVELVSGGPTPKPAVAVKTGGEHVGEPQHGEEMTVEAIEEDFRDLPKDLEIPEENPRTLGGYTTYSRSEYSVSPAVWIAVIVGATGLLITALCVICCCFSCFRGNKNPGYVLGNTPQFVNQMQPPEMQLQIAHPAQPLPNYPPGYIFQPAQQQHYPPERNQFQAPEERQHHYSPDCQQFPELQGQQQHYPEHQQFQTPQEQQRYQDSPSFPDYYNPPIAPPPPYSEKY